MLSNKKTILISVSIVAISAGLYFRGTDLLKKLVGYNVPPLEESTEFQTSNPSLPYLKLPEGFKINIFAKNLKDPRVITFDSSGRMLVSETEGGRVVLFEDKDKNGIAEAKKTLLSGLNKPHGLAFYGSGNTTYLYVAETQQVARYTYDVKSGTVISIKGENVTNLPSAGRHFTRTISFGPNFRETPLLTGKKGDTTLSQTKLYISVGSSCDVCVETTTWKRAAILESDPDGKIFTAEFAGGLRNSVFFTFHPKTKEIWATEMGRDNLGDNLPPDEINIIKVAGPEDKFGAKRYGWPFCYGNRVRDKTFNPEKIERTDLSSDCTQTESPAIQIQAHSAPLGLAFISDKKWPSEWQNDLLVAYHGSWNRSEPVGYKIVRYNLDTNGNVLSQKPEDFISGWLGDDGKISGRPVDLKFGPEGALFISDDSAGVIYKVTPK
ncbi:MAG: hypothetical protein A3I26_00725 [Candidatus Yanofskybacteria bacterium RIFCSPLOWO2_02_FULL_43_10]|uniref:Pyrroloquinoline quinone-dependent pyranose dehydrogenase beta-propeller domain-containing protein n=1 Tax=Candidatus Yanofskybacteria bacterium RIFCSPLOWO2_12_FULL_43_11b TaxID=1802710 RepID=A0A1F8H7L2_9BACT|nr:MAG: hypothetical protein A2742_00010 [Candidatus Yanofskybacteria bacterium RIFCSPHIGHO2_01_FULL_43_32]OGN10950.1 MAG: hypothetical protein A3C69_03150 [Candidatus Yanofskybacteria bacterium RIFCSPHIGHO2_02_FULL_43_12]OGN17098.1 MAG: hypothetical protein A3E34_03460 [Candidatus Yanofskybacteria bacterium RIFCSPHIGHO2_12_FULL_43_11]OGN24078.1 MAG: hypothetical protein A2923_01950 [Candidatus Yanofskybacteria bacterium RIFCSPLOWO2_01_FULL_43_46]OGN28498.1 MAG: hypothetical protein A3I26_00725